jgi:ABC-type dipeptide/oligopeptide/nickel transport system permease subunit
MSSAFWLTIFPVPAIAVIVFILILAGDGLLDFLDPRMKT